MLFLTFSPRRKYCFPVMLLNGFNKNLGRVCDTPVEGFQTCGEDQGINMNQETWIQGTIMVNHWFPLIRPASKLFLTWRGGYVRLTSHNTIFDAIVSLDAHLSFTQLSKPSWMTFHRGTKSSQAIGFHWGEGCGMVWRVSWHNNTWVVYLEDHPSGSKWLGSPPIDKPWSSAMNGRETTTRSLGDLNDHHGH